jgi:hypothetical protein
MALAETPEPASAGAVGRLQDSDRLRGAIGSEDNSAPLKNQARNGLIGLRVMAPSRCPRCHGTAAVIGAPKGPHAAALMCICGRHLGWISSDTFNFISVLVRRFGRPTEPIVVRQLKRNATVPVPARYATPLAPTERLKSDVKI